MRLEDSSPRRHPRRPPVRAATPWLITLLALAGAAGTVLAAATRGPDDPAAPASVATDTVPVFGPRAFQAGADAPALHVERFDAPAGPGAAYVLRVAPEANGAQPLRARIRLNGTVVVDAAALAEPLSVPVALLSGNVVEVAVQGGGGGSVRLALLQVPEPTLTVFGPRTFTRRAGREVVDRVRLVLPAGVSGPYRLHVENGAAGGSARVAGAVVRVNGAQVLGPADLPADVGSLMRDVTLTPETKLEVELRGATGSQVTLRMTGTDAVAPVLEVTAPAADVVTRQAQVEVTGTVRDATATGVTVNGVEAERTGDAFRATVPLPTEGTNTLAIVATDAAGNRTEAARTIIRDTQPPGVALLEPADGLVTRTAQTAVRGTVADATLAEASVNGTPVAPDAGGAFATTTALSEGANYVTLSAMDRAGNASSVAHSVTLDTQAPVLTVTGPAEGAVTSAAEVTVTGSVTDATAVVLTVNGAPAALGTGGAFSATVALSVGSNPIQLQATDAAGNGTSLTRTVTREGGDTGLPPDPADIAPPLEGGGATTVAGSTEFLYSGPNPVQTGVAPGTIQAVRASVVRGQVLSRDGAPLGGAEVRVLDHPELGQTRSRADGWFDLVVNGGGTLNLVYEKEGYLSANRVVAAQWQEYVRAEDVALVPLDPAVTAVAFSGTTAAPQVARGSIVTDADGARQATLVFDAGTEAVLEMPDGTTRPAGTLSIRATEYTVGEGGRAAMPAPLPPTSGYTYAVELSADEAIEAGAPHVRFSKPVAIYLENFLGFPVGTAVPAGWYDRQKGEWVPTDDGRVIGITAVAAGMAQVDADGDGAADGEAALAALGIDAAERGRLAAAYAPGQTLWRVQTDHFSWIDLNYPRGAPNAPDPTPPRPDTGTPEDDPCETSGSIIECENQVLGERLPVWGTNFTLNYRSDRVPGRRVGRVLDVALTNATVPASLRRVVVRVEVAGRTFADTLPAAPNQRWRLEWDGKDAYGRTLQGRQKARVSIGYVYPFYYMVPASSARSFGLTCTPSAGADYWEECIIPTTVSTNARQEDIRWQTYEVGLSPAGDWDARAQSLAGWTLDAHHAYDPVGRVLYLGDGTRRSTGRTSRGIETVAGGPAADSAGRNLYFPAGLAVAPDGSVIIASYGGARVWRLYPDGRLVTIAGTGAVGCSGDGGPATQATLRMPHGVAVGRDGSIYVGDANNGRVRRIAPDGIISTFAGPGQCTSGGVIGFTDAPVGDAGAPAPDGGGTVAAVPGPGDGGPANQASLFFPYGVAVAEDGSVYIADSGNNRIRRVSPDGIITTVAGHGGYGYGGDGGPAVQAGLAGPWGVKVAPDGSLYVADTGNRLVRRITPDGVITTVAGNIATGFGGDGGPATQAGLGFPSDVAVAGDGTVYIPDHGHVRRVSPDGIITSVAGTGDGCGDWEVDCGDGGPAAAARLGFVTGVSLGLRGDMYVATHSSHRIWHIAAELPGFTGDDLAIASEDGGELYRFDTTGRHLETLNALTGVAIHTFTYDAAGRLSAVRDADGLETRVERDADGAPTAIVSPFGQRTELEVDGAGWLSRMENAADEAVALEHTADGLLTGLVDPRGNAYAYTYDADGRLVRDTDPLGGFQALARVLTPRGYEVRRTTADGRTTVYGRATLATEAREKVTTNPAGVSTTTVRGLDERRTTVRPAGGTVTVTAGGDPRFGLQAPVAASVVVTTPGGPRPGLRLEASTQRTTVYDPSAPLGLGRQTERVTVNGRVTTTVYDAASRTVTRTSPAGRVSRTRLDAQGRVIEESAPGLTPVTYAYDVQGQLTEVRQGSRTWTYTYEGGYLATSTDPLGRTERYGRDAVGRVRTHTLADGSQLGFSYDASGNLTSLTPPGRASYRFDHDAVDQVTRTAAPAVGADSTVTRYAYGLDGELTGVRRPDGPQTDLSYDDAGRMQFFVHGNDATEYAYDTANEVLRTISRGDVDIELGYDGELHTTSTWSGPVRGTVGWNYDNNFRVVGEEVDSQEIQFAYDADGLLTAAGDMRLGRDPVSGLLRSTTLGGVSTQVNYDALGEPTELRTTAGGQPLLRQAFARDELGRLRTLTESLDGITVTWGYGYDAVGRLTSVTANGTAFAAYEYDANGNRVRVVDPRGESSGTYDAQDRVITFGGATYAYTPNGELSSQTVGSAVTRFEYDGRGNLAAAVLPDGTRVEYVLDGEGRRMGKKVNGTLVQGFLYGRGPNPVAEVVEQDGVSLVVKRFVYGTRANVPDYMLRDATTYALVTDHLGSVRRVVNAGTGEVMQALDYDAWGQVIRDTNPGFQPFGYAGGLMDAHTGLVRFGARDYDARTARWTTKDPIGFEGESPNLYAYVDGDPVNHIDPTGEVAWLVVPLVGAAGGAAIDLGLQLLESGGDLDCVDWGSIALSAGIGAVAASLGPSGVWFGRSRFGFRGRFNRGDTRTGWSWHEAKQRNYFGRHGGEPNTPEHWHNTPVPGPRGSGNWQFGAGGAAVGGAAGKALMGCDCEN